MNQENKKLNKPLLALIITALLVIIASGGVFLYSKYQDSKKNDFLRVEAQKAFERAEKIQQKIEADHRKRMEEAKQNKQ